MMVVETKILRAERVTNSLLREFLGDAEECRFAQATDHMLKG